MTWSSEATVARGTGPARPPAPRGAGRGRRPAPSCWSRPADPRHRGGLALIGEGTATLLYRR